MKEENTEDYLLSSQNTLFRPFSVEKLSIGSAKNLREDVGMLRDWSQCYQSVKRDNFLCVDYPQLAPNTPTTNDSTAPVTQKGITGIKTDQTHCLCHKFDGIRGV